MCKPSLLKERLSAKWPRRYWPTWRSQGKRVTVGADKADDANGFVKACRSIKVMPQVAQNTKRNGGSAIDSRNTCQPGYEVSPRKRKRIEQCFGWGKVIGLIRQVMVQGLDRVDQLLTLTMTAYNLTWLRLLARIRGEKATGGRLAED